MNNKYTQDMTGTGQHVELPDPGPEPEQEKGSVAKARHQGDFDVLRT